MSTLILDGVDPQQMEAGYLEYRRACCRLLVQDAREQSLIDTLGEPRTFDEVVAKWGRGGQPKTIQRLLTALVGCGAVVAEQNDGTTQYRANPDFDNREPERDLIAVAVGETQADSLLHATSYGNLVKVARDGNNIVQSDFIAANVKIWDEFLTLPFYEYFRKSSVSALADACTESGVVLDAACGLGYGLMELREQVPASASIMGVDISHDFVTMALDRTKEADNVVLGRMDLQNGLRLLADDTFDGAMIVGAWHFLAEPDDVLHEFARVLRPDGVLAIGYYYTTLNTYDRPLMDLRLSLRKPVARPTDPAVLASTAAGMSLIKDTEFTIGCFGFSTFRKRP